MRLRLLVCPPKNRLSAESVFLLYGHRAKVKICCEALSIAFLIYASKQKRIVIPLLIMCNYFQLFSYYFDGSVFSKFKYGRWFSWLILLFSVIYYIVYTFFYSSRYFGEGAWRWLTTYIGRC